MNKKKQLRDIRNENIYSDYQRLYYSEIKPNAIYRRLSVKYYIAANTVERIVSEKRKESRQADKIAQPP